MHLFLASLRGYGIGSYLLVFVVGLAAAWPLKTLREAAVFDVPGWMEQLIFWWSIAGANAAFAYWLENRDDGILVQDPDDATLFILVKPQHKMLWIPVQYWTWIFLLAGIYGCYAVWSDRS
jgi:hypothetical protein